MGVRTVQHGHDSGQADGAEFPAQRPDRVRRGAVRKLLTRVLRRAGPQVRRPRGANTAVVVQRAGVAVARATVRPVVHTGVHRFLPFGGHDVPAAGREHRERVQQHVAGAALLLAATTGADGQTLRLLRPRATASAPRLAAKRFADSSEQSSCHRIPGSDRAEFRVRGRHALRSRETVTRGL